MKEDTKPVTPERHSMEKREEIPPQVMPQHGFYGNFHPNAYMQQPQHGFYNPHGNIFKIQFISIFLKKIIFIKIISSL